MNQAEPRKSDGAAGITNVVAVNDKMFYFAATATAGDPVVIDTTTTTYGLGAAAKASATTDDAPAIGVMVNTWTAAGWYLVRTYGAIMTKTKAGELASAGLAVGLSSTGASVKTLGAGDLNRIGFSLEALAATTAGYTNIFVQLGG